MLLFYTPWKHQKTFSFSDVFRGYRKATPGCNGLRWLVGSRYGRKKTFCQNNDKFGCSFIKNDIVYVFTLYLQIPIILSLFKIDALNFTIYILTILISSLKTYVVGLHNPISKSNFLNDKRLYFLFIIVKRKPKTNKVKKLRLL